MKRSMGVYVDGFNLYHGLHAWNRCQSLWLDLVALASALRPRNEVAHVYYFTAPVLGDPEAASRQARYQQALQAHNPGLVTVVQGRYQASQVVCRRCGHRYTRYEEKETDVAIATTIVRDAAQKRFDVAMLMSADSDMLPALAIAQQLHASLFVLPAFPPKRNSDEVKRAFPAATHIGKAKVRQSQLPDTVVAEGRKLTRPDKWRPSDHE
jgi:uncharacterized LabA/DUF88 family protein